MEQKLKKSNLTTYSTLVFFLFTFFLFQTNPHLKLFVYRVKNKMMRVPVTYAPEFSIGAPEELFEGDFYFGGILNYDISPDGDRFVMIYDKLDNTSAQNYRIVLNWFDELKRLTVK